MIMHLPDIGSPSMLETPQRYPRAGSQGYPSPAAVANPDGSVDIYLAPKPPAGKERSRIQTVPGKGLMP